MRVDAETQIGLTRPVLEIVARLGPGAREIGNFVLRYAAASKRSQAAR